MGKACFKSVLSQIGQKVFVNNQITYFYNAAGNKLKKSYKDAESFYQGNVLKQAGQEIVHNGQSRAVKNTGKWGYEYNLKDHLGNTRVSFKALDDLAEPLQYKDYYPFGMELATWNTQTVGATKYLFGGKELQDEYGLMTYDFGWRQLDVETNRWYVPDPLMERHFAHTQYHYVFNNPMRFIDPFGLDTLANNNGLPHKDIKPVVVRAKRPGFLKRVIRKVGRFFKSLDNGGSGGSISGGISFTTNGNSIDPTRTTSRNPNDVEFTNIDDLLPVMGKVPGGALGGSLAGAEAINSLFQLSQELNTPGGAPKQTTDQEITEEHGGSQETVTDNTGKPTNTKPQKVDTTYTIAHSTPSYWSGDLTKSYSDEDTMGMTISYGNPAKNGGAHDSIHFIKY